MCTIYIRFIYLHVHNRTQYTLCGTVITCPIRRRWVGKNFALSTNRYRPPTAGYSEPERISNHTNTDIIHNIFIYEDV